MFICALIGGFVLSGCGKAELQDEFSLAESVFATADEMSEGRAAGIAKDLCVIDGDTGQDLISLDSLEAAGLFDVNAREVLYAQNVHERLYPASTTKILTALVALKYGNLEDIVTTSANVAGFAADESVCGLVPGDKMSMNDLIHGLLIVSGNDAGNAIAEHISGSVEAFAELMNEEAKALGATNSNFVNPHGLSDENHYTTAYDLYLIFQEAIKYDKFREIIHLSAYETTYESAHGTEVTAKWATTNQYLKNEDTVPDGAVVIGGKTGTTMAAGSCLVLLSENENGDDYVSVVLKAQNRVLLYENMTKLIEKIN